MTLCGPILVPGTQYVLGMQNVFMRVTTVGIVGWPGQH
jgi:hypothetical protein